MYSISRRSVNRIIILTGTVRMMIDGNTALLIGGDQSIPYSTVTRSQPTDFWILDNTEPDHSSFKSTISDDRCRFFTENVQDNNFSLELWPASTPSFIRQK